jgi:general secretion pathway protein G
MQGLRDIAAPPIDIDRDVRPRAGEAIPQSRVFRAAGPSGCAARSRRGARGFTFIELLVVTTILLILASAVMPLARVTVQRQKEAELRRYLREMRTAIDRYKDAADAGMIGMFDIKAGSEGYPPDLQTLVDGVSVVNDQSGRKLKFLRRVPIDPMTNSTEWGRRSYQDRPDSTSWGGQNVYDVYTTSTGTALDGTKYRDW